MQSENEMIIKKKKNDLALRQKQYCGHLLKKNQNNTLKMLTEKVPGLDMITVEIWTAHKNND